MIDLANAIFQIKLLKKIISIDKLTQNEMNWTESFSWISSFKTDNFHFALALFIIVIFLVFCRFLKLNYLRKIYCCYLQKKNQNCRMNI